MTVCTAKILRWTHLQTLRNRKGKEVHLTMDVQSVVYCLFVYVSKKRPTGFSWLTSLWNPDTWKFPPPKSVNPIRHRLRMKYRTKLTVTQIVQKFFFSLPLTCCTGDVFFFNFLATLPPECGAYLRSVASSTTHAIHVGRKVIVSCFSLTTGSE